MSEFIQDYTNAVTIGEYEASREIRATAEDLERGMDVDTPEEDRAVGRFTMRILERDNGGATDHLVEIVGADSMVGDNIGVAPLTVTVRPILRENDRGTLKTLSVAADGIILNSNSNTPNFESGYFLGQGIGEDELMGIKRELRIPEELPLLELPADIPVEYEQYDQNRRF